MTGFGVIVHTGAGFHSEGRMAEYEAVSGAACRAAMAELEAGHGALAAVEAALVILEDAPITNAGVGSCLTLEGTVECDACLACARTGLFGGVGALSNVRNASSVAAALLRQQLLRPTLEMGRIPPSILVGEGARKWALDNGHKAVPEAEMVTRPTLKAFYKYKRRLDRCLRNGKTNASSSAKRRRIDNGEVDSGTEASSLEARLDTVGAVCVDASGHVVAGASSGGIAMKFPGRVGQVCVPGAGCWAAENGPEAVGIATSGTGEHIMRTMLAMKAGQACLFDEEGPLEGVYRCLRVDFMQARSLDNVTAKNAGLIGLRTHAVADGGCGMLEFIYAHSTPSMSIGYMSSRCKKPTVLISRANPSTTADDANPEKRVTIGGQVVKFR